MAGRPGRGYQYSGGGGGGDKLNISQLFADAPELDAETNQYSTDKMGWFDKLAYRDQFARAQAHNAGVNYEQKLLGQERAHDMDMLSARQAMEAQLAAQRQVADNEAATGRQLHEMGLEDKRFGNERTLVQDRGDQARSLQEAGAKQTGQLAAAEAEYKWQLQNDAQNFQGKESAATRKAAMDLLRLRQMAERRLTLDKQAREDSVNKAKNAARLAAGNFAAPGKLAGLPADAFSHLVGSEADTKGLIELLSRFKTAENLQTALTQQGIAQTQPGMQDLVNATARAKEIGAATIKVGKDQALVPADELPGNVVSGVTPIYEDRKNPLTGMMERVQTGSQPANFNRAPSTVAGLMAAAQQKHSALNGGNIPTPTKSAEELKMIRANAARVAAVNKKRAELEAQQKAAREEGQRLENAAAMQEFLRKNQVIPSNFLY